MAKRIEAGQRAHKRLLKKNGLSRLTGSGRRAWRPIEARRAEVRQTNDYSRLVSDASKKLQTLEEAKGPTAELVARLISSLKEETAESTIHQLVEAAELTEGEARAFVGFSLVPRGWPDLAVRFTRITISAARMGDAPCIRDVRIPVATNINRTSSVRAAA